MHKYLQRLAQSRLARNSGWMLAGQGLRILVQAVYFVLIARALGAAQYGGFVGVTALVAILAPFATWGSGAIVVKQVARDPTSFSRYWGAALRTACVSAGLLGVLTLALSRFALPRSIPTALLIEVIFADLLFARLVDMGGQAFQAFQLLSRTAAFQLLIGLTRFVGALALFMFAAGRATALQWGGLYLASAIVSAIVTVYWVHRELGAADWSGRLSRAELKEGFHFSVSNSAMTVYNDIDKTMLVRLATLDSAGFYGAAYRILDVSFVPIRSLLFAAYSRFFAAGVAGIRSTLAFARSLLPFGVAYGLVAGAALYALSPIVPRFLGAEYGPSVGVLQFLCALPLLRVLHYFAADALTGADHQGLRSGVQVIVAGANIGLNLWLIPVYSWRGAVWSTLLSDGLLVVGLWAGIAVLLMRTKGAARSEKPPPGSPLFSAPSQ